MNRKMLTDALATGDMRRIFSNTPYKYFFWVDVDDKEVRITDYKTNPTTETTRKYNVKWEECLTLEEKRYLKQCNISGRICCFILTY